MTTDTTQLEVANLAKEDSPAEYKELEAKLAEFNAAPSHPLDEPEPESKPEPEPKAETPEVPVTPTIPVVPSHPAELLNAAREIGIDEQYLVPGAVQTQALLDFVVKMRLLEAKSQPQVQPKAEVVDDDEATLKYLKEEVGFDERALALFRKQAEKIKQLESRPDPETLVKQALTQREAVSSGEKAIDSAFNALGPKFEKLFGKGGLSDLGDGPSKSKRVRVFQAAGIDFTKDSTATIRAKITSAANDMYGDVLPEPPPPTVDDGKKKPTPEEWDRGALAKPTGTMPKVSKGAKAAAEHIREIFREKDINGYGSSQDEYEGIPN